jgi:predicted cation transporter
MAIPAFTHRGYWTRVVVFGAGLLVYAWGLRLMAQEHSVVGVLGIAVFSLLILFSGAGLIATVMRRPPRRSR